PRIARGHRAVDALPRDRRIGEVARPILLRPVEGTGKGLAGRPRHEMMGDPVLSALAVTDFAALGEDRLAFLDRAAAGGKLFALRTDHVVEVLDLLLAQGLAHIGGSAPCRPPPCGCCGPHQRAAGLKRTTPPEC